MESPNHDRLFKELLSTFFLEFIELFFPEILEYLDRSSIKFIDKEVQRCANKLSTVTNLNPNEQAK